MKKATKKPTATTARKKPEHKPAMECIRIDCHDRKTAEELVAKLMAAGGWTTEKGTCYMAAGCTGGSTTSTFGNCYAGRPVNKSWKSPTGDCITW